MKEGLFFDCGQPLLEISVHSFLRSLKSHYFSCSSRNAGSQRIVLTGTTSFHGPKYINFTVFSSHLLLN